MHITTTYNVFGYSVVSTEPQIETTIVAGGNADMCSEQMLIPLYAGETYPSPHDRRLPLAQIKRMACEQHTLALQANPLALNGGVYHDRDGQDETLLMLYMGNHPLMSSRFKARLAAKLAPLRENIKVMKQTLAALTGDEYRQAYPTMTQAIGVAEEEFRTIRDTG